MGSEVSIFYGSMLRPISTLPQALPPPEKGCLIEGGDVVGAPRVRPLSAPVPSPQTQNFLVRIWRVVWRTIHGWILGSMWKTQWIEFRFSLSQEQITRLKAQYHTKYIVAVPNGSRIIKKKDVNELCDDYHQLNSSNNLSTNEKEAFVEKLTRLEQLLTPNTHK